MSVEQMENTNESASLDNFRFLIGELQQRPPQESTPHPHLLEVDLNDLTVADMKLYEEYLLLMRDNFPKEAVSDFEKKLQVVASHEEHVDPLNPETRLKHPKENFLAYIRTLLVEEVNDLRHQEKKTQKRITNV